MTHVKYGRLLLLKILSAIVHVRYARFQKKHRYYIRDNAFSRLYQAKYFFRDFVKKRKYKTIEFCGEFQQELCFVLPFAYWHHLNGTLGKTISTRNTRELYFFSDNHAEIYDKRIWEYNGQHFEIPNMTHTLKLNRSKWAPVPLKKQFANDLFRFTKPILVIANKYNIEWNEQPLNFIDLPTLQQIIEACRDRYQIIYNRPSSDVIVSDNSDILDLHDRQWLQQNYPEVILMEDLYAQHVQQANNFNHFQLMVYANCDNFISVHGGTAALASYFGGTNIILSKNGIEHIFDEFQIIFPALSGANILHARSHGELIAHVCERIVKG